jgi:DNA-binding transcriptional LysR family regulator
MSQNAKDTDSHIGRRLKLRDLQILASVAQHGSMAKAAAQLATTQPTVSQAIADLEDAVGVRLFDRSTQEVVPTVTGEKSPWARRRKVALADLMDEGWLYGEPGNATQARISETILAKTGRLPRVAMYTTSMNLRLALLASGDYISCIPGSEPVKNYKNIHATQSTGRGVVR